MENTLQEAGRGGDLGWVSTVTVYIGEKKLIDGFPFESLDVLLG